jgi:hypothetical protein
MGALIDPSNLGASILPFGLGFAVGAIVGPILGGAFGGLLEGVMGPLGGDDSAPEASVAYAYHGQHGRHGQGMHPSHRGMMYSAMNRFKAKPVHDDFEKEYTNVEQTYSNHLFINDRKSSV